MSVLQLDLPLPPPPPADAPASESKAPQPASSARATRASTASSSAARGAVPAGTRTAAAAAAPASAPPPPPVQPVSLTGLVETWSGPHISTQYLCQYCNRDQQLGAPEVRTTASRRYGIERAPRFLAMHLKRFAEHGGRHRKLNLPVDVPLHFQHEAVGFGDARYVLVGFLEHLGTLDEGHYVAIGSPLWLCCWATSQVSRSLMASFLFVLLWLVRLQ